MIQLDPVATSQHISINFRQLQLSGIFVDSLHPPSRCSFITNRDPFPTDSIMLHCDMAWRNQFSPAAIAMITLNVNSKVVNGISKKIWQSSVLVGKARVVLVAVTLASAIGFSFIACVFDSTTVCDALSDRHSDLSWSIHAIVATILDVYSHLCYVSFWYISRQINHWTDVIIKFRLRDLLAHD